MNAVTPITITTADGVERTLRSTRGARMLIRQRFGTFNIQDLLNEHGEEAMFEIAWYFMHDENGDPPKDLPLNKFMWITPTGVESTAEIMAALTAALSQGGQQEKKDLEPKMLKALQDLEEVARTQMMKSLRGPSLINGSESKTDESITGDSSTAKSSHSLSNGEENSEILASVSA